MMMTTARSEFDLQDERDLISVLRHRALSDSPARFGFYERSSREVKWLSQRALIERSAALAWQIREQGVQPSSQMVIACKSPEHIITAYLAAILNGSVPLIHPIRTAFDRHDRIVTALREVTACFGDDVVIAHEMGDRIGNAVADFAKTVSVDVDTCRHSPVRNGLRAEPDATLHLQPTSGTTGVGKSVIVTHANALANIRSLTDRWEIRSTDRTVTWIPLYHDMGLVTSVLLPLVSGTDSVLMSPFDFLADPMSFLRIVSETRGTIATMPNFGFDLLARRARPEDLRALDLSSWRRATSGAEPIDIRSLRRFLAMFGPRGFGKSVITTSYGLAEATLMVTMQVPDSATHFLRAKRSDVARLVAIDVITEGDLGDDLPDPSEEEVDIVSVGRCGATTSVWIRDEQGVDIEREDVCGEVIVAGPSLSPGYRQPDGTVVAIDPNGFATGDVGFLHRDELYIVERIKNVIIRNGENHSAQLLEQQLAGALQRTLDEVVVIDSDVRPGRGRVTAIVGIGRAEDRSNLLTMLQGVQGRLSIPVDDVVFTPRGALPKTTSGKKQHMRLRQLLRENEITVLEQVRLTPRIDPDAEDIIDLTSIDVGNTALDEITRMARRRGFTWPISAASHLAHDLGFDSLARIELAAIIEARTGLGLTEEQLGQAETVGDITTMVIELRDLGEVAIHVPSVTSLIQSITNSIPQTNLIVQQQHGRSLLIGGRQIADFASLNYLGLDQHPDVLASIEPMIQKWGTHPSWTRAVASPAPYAELERELAALVGARDAVVFPTITLLHLGVLPLLAGTGTILVDQGSHKSMLEAAELAQARGARLVSVRRSDPADLDAKLSASDPTSPRIITVNGVYSMPGTLPDLRGYAAVAAKHGATLYVDDAHGFGVLGANPDEAHPYGTGGGGVVRHFGLGYENIIYVGGLSKAFSSMAAFITCRSEDERRLVNSASTMIFTGPIPVASLATSLAGLAVNRAEGDQLRALIHRLSMRIVEGARSLGFVVENEVGFPALTVVLGNIDKVVAGCRIAWQHRLLLTPAVFPAMPLDRGGLRFSVTALNTDAEVDLLLDALAEIKIRVDHPVPVGV